MCTRVSIAAMPCTDIFAAGPGEGTQNTHSSGLGRRRFIKVVAQAVFGVITI